PQGLIKVGFHSHGVRDVEQGGGGANSNCAHPRNFKLLEQLELFVQVCAPDVVAVNYAGNYGLVLQAGSTLERQCALNAVQRNGFPVGGGDGGKAICQVTVSGGEQNCGAGGLGQVSGQHLVGGGDCRADLIYGHGE